MVSRIDPFRREHRSNSTGRTDKMWSGTAMVVYRMSNDGVTVSSEVDLPPVLKYAQVSDGCISMHGKKWDGFECELLEVTLPWPFSAHLMKSPVFFTGPFVDLTAALNELARNSAPDGSASRSTVVFPVNSPGGDSELTCDAWGTLGCDSMNDVEFEDLIEADRASEEGAFMCHSSEDEEDEYEEGTVCEENSAMEFE